MGTSEISCKKVNTNIHYRKLKSEDCFVKQIHNHSPNFYECMSDIVKISKDITCTMEDS